jgi:hypothetical protein
VRLPACGASAAFRPSLALAFVAVLLAAGCGGHAVAPRAAAEVPSITLRANGAGRAVDARMTVKWLKDPVVNEFQRPAAGARFVQLDVQWRNLSAGKLPIEWARFSVLDQHGAAHPEKFRLPERELYHGRADTPRTISVGFELPEGAQPAALTLSSSVAALPLSGRWTLSSLAAG